MAASLKLLYLFLSLFTVIDGARIVDDELVTVINDRKMALKAEIKKGGDAGKEAKFLELLKGKAGGNSQCAPDGANETIKNQCEGLAKVLVHVFKEEWKIRNDIEKTQKQKSDALVTFYTSTTDENGVIKKIKPPIVNGGGDQQGEEPSKVVAEATALAEKIKELSLLNEQTNVDGLAKMIEQTSTHLKPLMEKKEAVQRTDFLTELQKGKLCTSETDFNGTALQAQCGKLADWLLELHGKAINADAAKASTDKKTFYNELPTKIKPEVAVSAPPVVWSALADAAGKDADALIAKPLVDEYQKLLGDYVDNLFARWYMILLYILLGVLLIAGVFYLLKKKGKKGKKTAENTPIADK